MTTFDELLLQVVAQEAIEQRIKLICDNSSFITTTEQFLKLIDQIPDGVPDTAAVISRDSIVRLRSFFNAKKDYIANEAQLLLVIKKIFYSRHDGELFWLVHERRGIIKSADFVMSICEYLPVEYTVFHGYKFMLHCVETVGNNGENIRKLLDRFNPAKFMRGASIHRARIEGFFRAIYSSKLLTTDQLEPVVLWFSDPFERYDFMESCKASIKTPKDLAAVIRLFRKNEHLWDSAWQGSYLNECITHCLAAETDLDIISTLLNSSHIFRKDNRASVIVKAAKTIKNFDDLQNVLSKLDVSLREVKAEFINAAAQVIATKEQCLAIRKLAVDVLKPLAPGELHKIWEKLPFSVRPHQDDIAEARGVLVKADDREGGMELRVISPAAHGAGLFSPPPRTGAAAGGAGASGPAPIPVSVHAETTETGYDPMYGT